ncbi:hypothetical protein BDU57DRAFT_541173 [Ampelomyces quisqualis]|uniref:Uncharacterized protein n=1 Tax=Ampelomyces quisqualis TaxID=50730 RepID=A0A6A5QEP7_AMPQU|nr:hypothetical protein BDU57DRAFT_541173 [Ampelomyces quisqualis]
MPPPTIPTRRINVIRLHHPVPSYTEPYTFEQCIVKWRLAAPPAAPRQTHIPGAQRERQESVFALARQAQTQPSPARQSTTDMSVAAMLNPQEPSVGEQHARSSSQSPTPSTTQVRVQSPGRISPAAGIREAASRTLPSEMSPKVSPEPAAGYVWFSQYPGQKWTDPRI